MGLDLSTNTRLTFHHMHTMPLTGQPIGYRKPREAGTNHQDICRNALNATYLILLNRHIAALFSLLRMQRY